LHDFESGLVRHCNVPDDTRVTLPRDRFLVVDDGEEDAFILCHLLERAGVADRVVCRSAETALEWLQTVDAPVPTAALLDVKLAARSGFEVLKSIRESEKLQSMVVVLLSGSEEPRNLGKALQLGADGYLVKFPTISAMRDVVDAVRGAAGESRRRPLPVSCNLLLGAQPLAASVP
jgi:CheY-like chemotaxis protein